MPILKSTITPNGAALGYHRAIRMSVDLVANTSVVTVISHVDETAYKNGLPHAWNWEIGIPVALLDASSAGNTVELALITPANSPFYQGTVVSDDSQTLETYKLRKWAVLKDARTAAEMASFTCDGSMYQADKERISGAVQLALLAQLAGQPFTIDWTLTDNSVKTLDASQMIAVGVALGKAVSAIFDTARSLRTRLDAATTIEEVDAIGWPA